MKKIKQPIFGLMFLMLSAANAQTEFVLTNISAEEMINDSIPEHSAEDSVLMNKELPITPYLECMVDTPAWDEYTRNMCAAAGTAYTTTAVFRVGGIPSWARVVWHTPGCPAYAPNLCLIPITQNSQLTAVVSIYDDSRSIVGPLVGTYSITARYLRAF